MDLLKKGLAELFGTCALVFLACGTAVLTGANVVATALAFGLVIVVMSKVIGDISGCHINPAVSLAMLITKRMSLKEFLVYLLAQFVGATLGALLLALCTGFQFEVLGGNEIQYVLYDGANLTAKSYISAILVEIVLTAIFVLTILKATDESKGDTKFAGLYIGVALVLVHLIGITLTGTSVNPARSFGPALLQAFAGESAALKQIWIFLVGPFAGGALAALVYMLFNKKAN